MVSPGMKYRGPASLTTVPTCLGASCRAANSSTIRAIAPEHRRTVAAALSLQDAELAEHVDARAIHLGEIRLAILERSLGVTVWILAEPQAQVLQDGGATPGGP